MILTTRSQAPPKALDIRHPGGGLLHPRKSSRPGVRKLTPITAPTGTALSNSDKGVRFALNMPSPPSCNSKR